MKRSGLVNFSWFFNVCSSTDLSVCRRGGGWWCDCQWGGECCCESSSLESKWAKNVLINNQKGWRFYPCGLRTVFVPAKHLSTDSIKSLLVAWKHRKMLAKKSGFVLKLNCDWLGKWQEFFSGNRDAQPQQLHDKVYFQQHCSFEESQPKLREWNL